MPPFGPILFLLLLTGLGSKALPSASPPGGSDSQGRGQPPEVPTSAPENSTRNQPAPGSPAAPHQDPPKTPLSVSPDTSLRNFRGTPSPDLPKSLETPTPDLPATSAANPQGTPQTDPSKATLPEPSETPKPEQTGTPQPRPPDAPKPNPSQAPLPDTPETPHAGPTPATQESPETPKQDAPKISPGEALGTPSPGPTQPLYSEPLETYEPDTLPSMSSATHPDHSETPQPVSLLTHNLNPTDTPQGHFPTTHHQNAPASPVTSALVTSVATEPPTPFQGKATALNEPDLSPSPEGPAAAQAATADPPPSGLPGAKELKIPSEGPDTPPRSARIAGAPAPPELPNQAAPAVLHAPQRHSRGETVNTIILVERVKETGVTLVSRPRGSTSGALCLFFAGTGLLIGVFLLLWCLYRRASRHRSFAHHRLTDSADEPVLHLDTPKDPFDPYFYAPDAWVPSHIATKQPPPTPPLPPKLPPPPRGGQPQRLEALSAATLPNNFV